VLTRDPKNCVELASSMFAQALTALSYDYKTEIFCMAEGISLVKKDYINGLKFETFQPLNEMLNDFIAMGGILYACYPSFDARKLSPEDCLDDVICVNASKLLGSAKEAMAVFTY
jgi:predicted peroxiredoxin